MRKSTEKERGKERKFKKSAVLSDNSEKSDGNGGKTAVGLL